MLLLDLPSVEYTAQSKAAISIVVDVRKLGKGKNMSYSQIDIPFADKSLFKKRITPASEQLKKGMFSMSLKGISKSLKK
tara:strand:- start:412 stop:648 length:237 start_codon:yes stop_codon:yes gene_type:complete